MKGILNELSFLALFTFMWSQDRHIEKNEPVWNLDRHTRTLDYMSKALIWNLDRHMRKREKL